MFGVYVKNNFVIILLFLVSPSEEVNCAIQFQKTQGFRVAKSATLICISTVLKKLIAYLNERPLSKLWEL